MSAAPPGASSLRLPPGPWPTLLDGLCAQFPAIDRAQWQSRFARARVLDEANQPLAATAPYRPGHTVRYFREVAAEPQVAGVEAVLHVDADLVVADKPHGLPVVPAGPYVEQTLLRRLIRRLDNPELVPLHRIDRDTAGLVLFSARAATRGRYQALFHRRAIAKRYLAVAVDAELPAVHRSRLVPGEPFFRMREAAGAANSETAIERLWRADGLAGYALRPLSGRKHQLRVHMAALGAPIAHDPLYPELRAAEPARPLQLLAESLAFSDPLSAAPRAFRSQLRLALWRG